LARIKENAPIKREDLERDLNESQHQDADEDGWTDEWWDEAYELEGYVEDEITSIMSEPGNTSPGKGGLGDFGNFAVVVIPNIDLLGVGGVAFGPVEVPY
jgi:hypothetical protein